MTLTAANQAGLRSGARAIGVTFQALAILTFMITIYATEEVAHAGTQIGVGTSQDPITWFVFIGGTFAALMFTGVGHVLGMLCAVYDRQDANHVQVAELILGSKHQADPTRQPAGRSDEAYEVPTPITSPPLARSAPVKTRPQITTHPASPASNGSASPPPPKRQVGVWEWLTRERHLSKRRRHS